MKRLSSHLDVTLSSNLLCWKCLHPVPYWYMVFLLILHTWQAFSVGMHQYRIFVDLLESNRLKWILWQCFLIQFPIIPQLGMKICLFSGFSYFQFFVFYHSFAPWNGNRTTKTWLGNVFWIASSKRFKLMWLLWPSNNRTAFRFDWFIFSFILLMGGMNPFSNQWKNWLLPSIHFQMLNAVFLASTHCKPIELGQINL